MRTYKILKSRASAFDADPEVQDLLREPSDPGADALLASYTRSQAEKVRGLDVDPATLGAAIQACWAATLASGHAATADEIAGRFVRTTDRVIEPQPDSVAFYGSLGNASARK